MCVCVCARVCVRVCVCVGVRVFRQPLSKEAQISLIGVVHQMITDGNLKFAQLLRDALVVKVGKGSSGILVHVVAGKVRSMFLCCAVEPVDVGCFK